MFNMHSQPTLRRLGRWLWRVDDNYIPTGGSALESADSELESADSSADSNADPPEIGLWVRASSVQ